MTEKATQIPKVEQLKAEKIRLDDPFTTTARPASDEARRIVGAALAQSLKRQA